MAEKDYDVTLTLKFRTTVTFSDTEGRMISELDAVENAKGMLPLDIISEAAEAEGFNVSQLRGWAVEEGKGMAK